MRVNAGARTDVGRVRDMNQDAFLVAEPLYGIADGMGGHAAGDVAAETAVTTVRTMFEENPPTRPDDLARYLEEANANVWEKANAKPELQGMGTTFTLIHVDGDNANLGHVGDSRAYLFRDGSLRQITKDHTLVQRMVDEGRIKPEEAPHHPQRNVISRALGVDGDVDVDISQIPLRDSDRLLICSDGLTSMLSDEQIATILRSEGDVEAVAGRLVDAANEAGGEDNITVVVLDVSDGDNGTGSGAPAQRTHTPVAPAAPVDDAIRADPDDYDDDEPRRSRKWLVWVTVLLVLGAGAYFSARFVLLNSWYVGSSDAGEVVIYRGIPEEIVGLSFKDEYEETDLAVDALPTFLQSDVTAGIKKDSLEEARATVEDLERQSAEFGTPEDGERSK